MGSLHTKEYANAVMREELELKAGVTYQLRYNHFPAIPYSMIDVCIRAIKRARKGDLDGYVRLPADIRYKGKTPRRDLAPISAVITAHHLDEFVDPYLPDWEGYDDEDI